jgi:hypothetical protein
LAALVFGTCWLTAVAQNPPPSDPDAKGKVTIDSIKDGKDGTFTITVTRSASDGWGVGTVTALVMLKDGGLIRGKAAFFKTVDGQEENTGTAVYGLPKGTYVF